MFQKSFCPEVFLGNVKHPPPLVSPDDCCAILMQSLDGGNHICPYMINKSETLVNFPPQGAKMCEQELKKLYAYEKSLSHFCSSAVLFFFPVRIVISCHYKAPSFPVMTMALLKNEAHINRRRKQQDYVDFDIIPG